MRQMPGDPQLPDLHRNLHLFRQPLRRMNLLLNRQLQYLYTIARNLCSQHYRDKTVTYSLEGEENLPVTEGFERTLLQRLSLQKALEKLSPEERELLFLRYVNEVPVPVISGLYRISRFAVYRKLNRILRKVRVEMEADRDA